MKVKIVRQEDLQGEKQQADLLIIAGERKTIKYRKELSGESRELKNLAELSAKHISTVVCPFDTDNYGILRHSAGVFDNGKLLGISDMTVSYEDSPYMPGIGGNVYETACGKISLAVGDDFYSYELLRSYAVCGVNAVIAIKSGSLADMDRIVLRAYSYLLGMPIILLSGDRCVASDVKGNILFDGNDEKEFEVTPLGEYYLKISKTRFSK